MDRLPFKYELRAYWEFYCPVCRSQRRSLYWPSPRPHHYWGLAILSLVFAVGFSPWFGFKGFFLIFPFWAAFEFVYRARARQSLICGRCGFDPYLYKYDVKLARDKVERFFAEKKRQRERAVGSVSGAPLGTDSPEGSAQDHAKRE